ncbi:putative zinc finger protein [Orchesella cincta]|uniref:Putative zinc finger protein n=1 Tax=Orchesella cincta TaxID=48709 RepID=A0A1D2M820_ORCCI|nr:putative zinc finger protein [Orchesella cincta]
MELECSECQESFPVLTQQGSNKDLSARIISSLTRIATTVLVAASSHPVSFSNREPASQHLSSYHIRAAVQKACSICGMPWPDLRSSEFRDHLFSHMNEEEKLEALRLQGRRYKELVTPLNSSWRNDSSLSFLPKAVEECYAAICGATLCNKKLGDTHEEPTSKREVGRGPLKCKFPGCLTTQRMSQISSNPRKLILRIQNAIQNYFILKVHGNVHSGAKPWKCSICPKSFPLKNTLELHLVTNHDVGTKMFKCDVEGCGKLFRIRSYHRSHVRTVHGVFTKKCRSQREASGKTQE